MKKNRDFDLNSDSRIQSTVHTILSTSIYSETAAEQLCWQSGRAPLAAFPEFPCELCCLLVLWTLWTSCGDHSQLEECENKIYGSGTAEFEEHAWESFQRR
jgi:hypothetical protein